MPVEVYRVVPYLAVLERRKDLLPKSPLDVDESIKEEAADRVKKILYSRSFPPSPVDPSVFFIEANLVAFSPSRNVWERFALYYARMSVPLFSRKEPSLLRHFPVRPFYTLGEFLSIDRPFPELKVYHLEVSGGRVYLGDRAPLLGASLLYSSLLSWIEEKVRKIVLSGSLDELSPYAQRALQPPFRKRRGYPHIQKLMSAVGIPDGRKRILFYWLIPYWVTVEGRSPEEVLDLANEWISRQSGGKIYSSWILAEAENVRSKGIKPWSVTKVEKVDPELVRMLRGMGLL